MVETVSAIARQLQQNQSPTSCNAVAASVRVRLNLRDITGGVSLDISLHTDSLRWVRLAS